MKKRILSSLLTLCMVLCLVPVAAQVEAGGADITEIDLKGLSSELWSYKDLTFATIDDDAGYTIKEQVWTASEETSIKPDSASLKPKAGKEYTFIITLEAKDGYVFPIKSETAVFYDGTVRLDGTEYDGGATRVSTDGKTLTAILFPLTKAKGVTLSEMDVSTEDELAAALGDTLIDRIRLTADIDLTARNASTTSGLYVHLAITREVTLDLNGYVLKGTGANSRTGVFEVMDGGDLTIIDSRPTVPHRFTDSDGLWVLDEQNGDKTANGGIITGGRTNGGGGVKVCEGGKLTITGGSIVGCVSENVNGSGGGGGVYIRDGGTFVMSGGGIIGCVAQDRGGGVFFYKSGTFTMTGGVIQICTANDEGGDALYLYGGTMNAGGGTVDGTVVVYEAYDSASHSMIPGVIQGSGSTATQFNGDVINYGEIKHGTFGGTVTLGNATFCGKITDGVFNGPVTTASEGEADISDGVFNGTVTINRGKITGGIFNKDVVVGNAQESFSCTTLTGGTYNRLIINKSAYAAFAGARSPLGIVGEKPTGVNGHNYHKVTFDLAGGKMDYPVRYFLHNGNISSQVEPDFRAGYFFAGWYKGENKWNYSDTVGEDDLTLTAHWIACDHSGHTGERPDCTTSVICTACGGTIAALGHDFSVQHNNDEHWKKCSRCDVIDGKEPHDWDNGKVTVPASCTTSGERLYTCDECGFEKTETIQPEGHDLISHAGQAATCTENGWKDYCTCSHCDYTTYQEIAATGNHTYEWQSENGWYWQRCKVCREETTKKPIPELRLLGAERVCRTQDYTFSVTIPEGCKAPEAGYEFTMVGSSVDLTGTNGSYTATVKTEWYDAGENTFYVGVYAVTEDGFGLSVRKKVTILNAHTGGTATCKDKAVCEVCGEIYGGLDADNHADLKHIDEAAATKDAEGNIEYWYCEACGKYYADAAASREITKAETVTEKLPNETKSPQTGDTGSRMLWLALLFVGGGVAVALTMKRKRSCRYGGNEK